MVTIQRARFAAYYRNPIRGFLHADNLDGDFGLRSASVRAKRTSTGCPAPHTLGNYTIGLCPLASTKSCGRSTIFHRRYFIHTGDLPLAALLHTIT